MRFGFLALQIVCYGLIAATAYEFGRARALVEKEARFQRFIYTRIGQP